VCPGDYSAYASDADRMVEWDSIRQVHVSHEAEYNCESRRNRSRVDHSRQRLLRAPWCKPKPGTDVGFLTRPHLPGASIRVPGHKVRTRLLLALPPSTIRKLLKALRPMPDLHRHRDGQHLLAQASCGRSRPCQPYTLNASPKTLHPEFNPTP
jgi:hypothetical protein